MLKITVFPLEAYLKKKKSQYVANQRKKQDF